MFTTPKWYASAYALCSSFGMLCADAFASDDPFEKAKTKSQSLIDNLLEIAVYVCALAIIAAMLGMFFNKIPKTWGIAIIVAGIVIGSSMTIARFLIE